MSALWDSPLSPRTVRQVARLSYAQAMLGSIYGASTGGMFLVGYALKLGANKVHIGLMSSIPMLCVIVQLLSSMIVEGGASRRRLTFLASLLNVSGWTLIILIPYVAGGAPANARIGALIAIITAVTIFGNLAGNARGSWVGDLVPAAFRGTFFGRMAMYGGIVGTIFAILEGTFLDNVKSMGIGAFSWLFGFGMVFGLLNTMLFALQPDVPLGATESRPSVRRLLRDTFANRPLMLVMAYALLWTMQMIAWPFYVVYMLEDLRMPFLGVGIVGAVQILSMLAASPFWGRVVNRYGSRPVLIVCTAILTPTCLFWLPMDRATLVYLVIPPVHLVAGFAVAGLNVALSTLIYKVTPSVGRSMQLAVYSILVVLISAPMPTLGAYLPRWARAMGFQADVRLTFAVSMIFAAGAALAAWRIRETGALGTRDLLRRLPRHLWQPSSLREAA